MEPDGYVTVQVVVDEPTTGLWCDQCLLPSAVEFKLHGLHAGEHPGPSLHAGWDRPRPLDPATADVGDPRVGGVVDVGVLWVCDRCKQARQTCGSCGQSRPVPFDRWFGSGD